MNRSMWASPYNFRAASLLWTSQRTLQFSTVDGPPFPRGTTWSISSLTSDPHTPPESSFHWHLPSSRLRTSRFTLGGTLARRFSCWASSRSSAASITCSSVAPGCTCDCPTLARFSFATSALDTVTWIRLTVAVSGSTTVLAGSRTCTGAGSGAVARSSPG